MHRTKSDFDAKSCRFSFFIFSFSVILAFIMKCCCPGALFYLEKTPSLQLLNFSLQEEYLFWIIILHLLISTFDSDIQSKSLMMLSSFIHNYGHIFLSSTDLIVFTIIFMI